MADEFGVDIQGVLKATLRFEEFPQAMRAQLLAAIRRLTASLAAKIRARLPRGPTGKLEGSLIQQIFDDPDQVSGRVTFDKDFGKVGALEWGAPGKRAKESVREHSAKLDHAWAQKLARPMTVVVAKHNRSLHLEARRFLRGPLAASRGEIEEVLHQAVLDAISGGDE